MTYEVIYEDENGIHEVYVQGEEKVREILDKPNMGYQVFMNVTTLF